jgi:hypothetical protein
MLLLLLPPAGGRCDLSAAFQQALGAPAAAAAAAAAAATAAATPAATLAATPAAAAAAATVACRALYLAVRGLAASLSSEGCLPLGTFTFAEAVSNAVKAAKSGVQLQAVDMYSLGMSCIKLAAAASSLPDASDRLQAAILLTIPGVTSLTDAMQNQHASVAPPPAAAVPPCDGTGTRGSSSSDGPVLAALLWARTLSMIGQGCIAMGSSTAAELDSKQLGEDMEGGQAVEEQSDADSEDHAIQLITALQLCSIGLDALAKLLLPSVQLLGAPGSKKACAAAHQQLQQQCSQLQQQYVSLVDEMDKAKVGWGPLFYLCKSPRTADTGQLPQDAAAAVSMFGAQLVQFGGALCAQLPVPLCCNNPGCVELRGASEQ